MAEDWLYPLSSKSDYTFEKKRGQTSNTGPGGFEEMINDGGTDKIWGVSKNWLNMSKDDRVWVYYGAADGDMGIVGLATVRSVQPPSQPRERAEVHLRWDHETTHRLISDPFPASIVRGFIPRPQGSVWHVPAELATRLQRHAKAPKGLASEAEGRAPVYGNGVSSQISYTPPKTVTVNRRHDALIRPFKTRLESFGWRPVGFSVGTKQVDLAMRRGKAIVLVEAKTVTGATSSAVRAAFAQLAEYEWRYRKGHPRGAAAITRWALFERAPDNEEIEFLEDHNILISWASTKTGRLLHSINTARSAHLLEEL